MALFQDDADERAARIDQWIQVLEASRNATAVQLVETQRRLNDIEARIKQLQEKLAKRRDS